MSFYPKTLSATQVALQSRHFFCVLLPGNCGFSHTCLHAAKLDQRDRTSSNSQDNEKNCWKLCSECLSIVLVLQLFILF